MTPSLVGESFILIVRMNRFIMIDIEVSDRSRNESLVLVCPTLQSMPHELVLLT